MAENTDPRAYLETDARIIAENDQYAVVALRIDKSYVANNLLFIAAVANLLPRIAAAIEHPASPL